ELLSSLEPLSPPDPLSPIEPSSLLLPESLLLPLSSPDEPSLELPSCSISHSSQTSALTGQYAISTRRTESTRRLQNKRLPAFIRSNEIFFAVAFMGGG